MSIQYLAGAEIDYREDLEGAQFVIRNPERHDDVRLRLFVLDVSSARVSRVRMLPAMARKVPDVLAAVDLGSNSFHMVVARYSHGQLIIIDRLREMVRLAAGLDEHGRLDKEATARALACLRAIRPAAARHEGRERARRRHQRAARGPAQAGAFLDRAREALGHPIEIISGIEEARLIYLGVAHTMPSEPGRRLVVDIGGGSTELIIGEGMHAARSWRACTWAA